MAGYAASGMTQRAFAQREGINPFTFAGWLRQRRMAAAAPQPAPSVVPRFVELGFPRVAVGFGLEVVLPDGLIVRGSEAKQLGCSCGGCADVWVPGDVEDLPGRGAGGHEEAF
jgi:hypothetical protein